MKNNFTKWKLKAIKKAFAEIKAIKTASNMLDIEAAINTGILKTFGLYNIGLMKIAMSKGEDYAKLRIAYGCHTYGNDFAKLKEIRTTNFNDNRAEVKQFFISIIPDRFNNCEMFKKMILK